MNPRIGLIPGDPSGIGPELVARLLADKAIDDTNVLLIGDRHVLEMGQEQAGIKHDLYDIDATHDDWLSSPGFALHSMDTIARDDVRIARSTVESGKSTLRVLDQALDLVQAGRIDAIVFAPFNKSSMHMAGIGHADELHYMAEMLRVTGYVSELNTLDGMWTSRVTSHIPLKDVAASITSERITHATHLIDSTLRRAGYERPRIAVAALNPHGGDSGNFGREEIDVIEPAVRAMAERQMAVEGPLPSDTVFLKVTRGELDAVVTMYHDQGQIALKLLGFDRGVTVQGGLPVPVTTPAHGTAFDIAGQGQADVGAIRAAFEIARTMVTHWSTNSPE
ncbi:MAG: 4-hydroxythreonine-4-phosphate dehydrogenase PdxA [Granulosicoccus sp.]|nr:4-hydroxythreonine-4-phosphate dehydrogenase PdxA [Granulosicoccus sp.]